MSISNSFQENFKTVTQITNNTIQQVTGVAEKAKETLNQLKAQSIDQINLTTTQAIDQLTETSNKAQASLNQTIHNTTQLNDTAQKALQQAIITSVNNWLETHPLLAWLIAHPISTLILLFLLCFLLGVLLVAIAQLTTHFWLTTLRFPLKVSGWLVPKMSQTFSNQVKGNKTKTPSPINDQQQRLLSITARLEELKREQEDLWQEMRLILSESP